MEYNGIDDNYSGLICKQVEVIDPENDNIIEIQKIKTKNKDDSESKPFKIFSLITSGIIVLIIIFSIFYYLYKRDLKNVNLGFLIKLLNDNVVKILFIIFLFLISLITFIILLID